MAEPGPNNHIDTAANTALSADVNGELNRVFGDVRLNLSGLDRWTERRIREENLAKAELVAEADDPVEHCYQNLVREIDTEARNGIFLANPAAEAAALRNMTDDAGVSGRLHSRLVELAPRLFPDEYEHSNGALDIVWAVIGARYDRAHAEALVSERIIAHLLDDADAASDMADALRAMFYAWHEDEVRRSAGLNPLLGEPEASDLRTMVEELATRCGSYSERVRAICRRSGTA